MIWCSTLSPVGLTCVLGLVLLRVTVEATHTNTLLCLTTNTTCFLWIIYNSVDSVSSVNCGNSDSIWLFLLMSLSHVFNTFTHIKSVLVFWGSSNIIFLLGKIKREKTIKRTTVCTFIQTHIYNINLFFLLEMCVQVWKAVQCLLVQIHFYFSLRTNKCLHQMICFMKQWRPSASSCVNASGLCHPSRFIFQRGASSDLWRWTCRSSQFCSSWLVCLLH